MNVFTKMLLVLFALFAVKKGEAQNLLDLSQWVVGTGTTAPFNQNGSTIENIREWGIGPYGERVVLWKAIPDGNADGDGGWNSDEIQIDHKKKYRFTVWMKKTNSNSGTSYLGCLNVNDLSNNSYSNPYFWYGNLPQLDKWYLLVGFVHGSGDESTVSEGGVYDGVTGKKVVAIEDFKFAAGTQSTVHRTYLFYDPNTNNRQYFYAPRVEAIDGNEVPLEVLLGGKQKTVGEAFFEDNVGIKTENTRGNALAVNGNIRAKEIKVETANWPDYVFKQDYHLKSLIDLAKYINENGHLPEVPKASEVESNGLSVGEMNKLLLKKVEELTLYLIEKDKKVQDLEHRLQVVERKQ